MSAAEGVASRCRRRSAWVAVSTTWDSAPERPPAPLGPDAAAPVAAPGSPTLWSGPGPHGEPAASNGPGAPLAGPDGSEPRTGEAAWPAWTAPVGLVGGLLVAIVGGLLVALIAVPFGAEITGGDAPPGVLLGGTIMQDIGFVGAAVLLAFMTGGRPWAAQFGLRKTPFWWSVLWVVALYFAFLVFAAIWQAFVEIEEDTDLLRELGADRSDVLLVLAALLVCVLAPLVEEFFFRGFFFRALFNWRGVWPAAILTGVVFGAIHIGSSPIGALVPLAFFGFGLCLLYWRTRSLYPCIAVHAINNSIAFGSLNDWTWQIPVLLVASLAVCAAVCALAARRWPPPTLGAAAPPRVAAAA